MLPGILIVAMALQPLPEAAHEHLEAAAEAPASMAQDTELSTAELVAQAPTAIILPRDTPVHLMVLNEVSTKDHSVGHRFKLRVDKGVVVDGREVIPVGTTAWGELMEASESGVVGKSGKLSARLSHIEFGGLEIPIEGETSASGKSGKGATILGALAMGPLGLLARGNNAKIKAGEKMTGFVSADVSLDAVE